MNESASSAESGLIEYEVTAIGHSDTAVGGEEANVHIVKAESEEAAEQSVKKKPGVKRVERGCSVKRSRAENGEVYY